MNNYLSMTAEFEKEKKRQAALITLGVAGAILLIVFLIKWPLPTLPTMPVEEYVEVDIGSSEDGFGSDQPLLPGEPAPAEQPAYTPPQPVQAVSNEAKDVETDDRVDNDAPAIKKPVVTSNNATRINDENKTAKPNNSTQQPAANPTPTPPRPKAVLGRTIGGTGNGGNGADTYQRGGSEGDGSGTGDKGSPGGSPNGNYAGRPKNFGVKVLNIPGQSFEDEFNENAKIAMDITTDANGKVISATYQPRGSTSSNKKLIDIAKRRAYELKSIGNGDGPQKGTVVFNFVVRS